jgi:large subunit ribosomal protein L35Ae
VSQLVEARITNYRIGIRTQMSKEILIQFSADSVAQLGALVGRKVVWKNGKKKLVGKIVGLHGKNGMLKAKFKKGVPGQAIGQTVELVNS